MIYGVACGLLGIATTDHTTLRLKLSVPPTGVSKEPSWYPSGDNPIEGYVLSRVILPPLKDHPGSDTAYEKWCDMTSCLRYVEGRKVPKPSESPCPLLRLPAGEGKLVEDKKGAQGALQQAERLLLRIASLKSLGMNGHCLELHLPQVANSQLYAAAVLLLGVSLMTKCAIKSGTVTVCQVAQSGALLPVPDPTETWEMAVALYDAGYGGIKSIIMPTYSCDRCDPETFKGSDVEAVLPEPIDTAAELLRQCIEWGDKAKLREDVCRAVMTPSEKERGNLRTDDALKAVVTRSQMRRPENTPWQSSSPRQEN